MSLLVAGTVMQARVDIKLAQLHATRARVEAAADGAIQLSLAELLRLEQFAEESTPVLQSQVHALGGYDVRVNFTPVSGLINLNAAPEELLVLLFSSVDDLEENAAEELAFNVVEWRSANSEGENAAKPPSRSTAAGNAREQETDTGTVRHARFEAIEDLLLVSGVDRHIFEAVRDAVYVSQVEQSGVDWASAPVSVLSALGGGDLDAARELAESRSEEQEAGLVAPDSLDLSFQEASALSSFRIDAVVQYDGSAFNRRRWVDRAKAGSDGLPWSFFRTEPLRALPSTVADGLITEDETNAGS
jgi:general secretion pathway protein K